MAEPTPSSSTGHPSEGESRPQSRLRDSGSLPDQDALPKPKRQKVTTACDICRSKKIKCDGIEPVCGPCQKRKERVQCTWTHGLSRGSGPAAVGHMLRLEQRIRELEQGNVSLGQNTDIREPFEPEIASVSGPAEPVITYRSSQSSIPREHFRDRVPISQTRHHQSPHAIMRESISLPPDDASIMMDQSLGEPPTQTVEKSTPTNDTSNPGLASAMVGSVTDDSHVHGFFGGSSAGSFISQVRRAVEQKMGTSKGSVSSQEMQYQISSPDQRINNQPRSTAVDYVLPSRKKADALMSVYWDAVHPLYPFVDKIQTTVDYESLWTGHGVVNDDPIFLCIINVIFALSCQLNVTVTPEQRKSTAEVFFQRAREHLDLWKMGSLESVQVFLLLGQYLQSTNEPHQCWMFVGLAVRTAESLGLHLPETSERIPSPRYRELLRRIWHGCILMDRVLAMTYGRPTMIGRSVAAAVPFPLARDEENLPKEAGPPLQPLQTPSKLDFFIHSLHLYGILYEILVDLYSPHLRQDHSGQNMYENYLGYSTLPHNGLSILEIDRKLMSWENNLPNHLKYREEAARENLAQGSGPGTLFTRQSLVLRQRYLHIRLLSLRPILSAFVACDVSDMDSVASFSSILSHRIAHQCSVVCIKVAQETIDLVYVNRATDWATTGLIAAWWYNVLFVYSAATVLIAGRLRSSILSELPEESILQSWQRAIKILEDYSRFSASIPRLVATLHLLFEEVPIRYSHHKHHPPHSQECFTSEVQPQSVTLGQNMQLPSNHSSRPHSHDRVMAWSNHESGDVEDFERVHVGDMVDYDLVFDPGDLSWLNTVPFGLEMQ